MDKLLYIYFIIINLIGFYIMYIDKRKAIENKWRVSESTLISIAIIGGSLGSLLGMYTFRHKTKHIKFTIGIPFIMLIQFILFII
ncbi:MAG: DUF1294 domain-containing protein [Romboutsia sp.]